MADESHTLGVYTRDCGAIFCEMWATFVEMIVGFWTEEAIDGLGASRHCTIYSVVLTITSRNRLIRLEYAMHVVDTQMQKCFLDQ